MGIGIIAIMATSTMLLSSQNQNQKLYADKSIYHIKSTDKSEFTGTMDMSDDFFQNLSLTINEMAIQSK